MSACPTSIIGYGTSSSSISVQSSRETESLQLKTVFTTKEDLYSSSSTYFVTGKNNLLAFTLLDWFQWKKKTGATATKGKETLTEMSRSIDSTKELWELQRTMSSPSHCHLIQLKRQEYFCSMDYLIIRLDSNQHRYSSPINISIEKEKTETATNRKETLA